MKNKRIMSAAMAVLMAGSLAACGGSASSTADSTAAESTSTAASTEATAESTDEPVTIRITWWGGQTRHDLTQQVLDLYTSEHPNVTFEAMPGGTAGARAASPRPAMLLWPIKKIRSTNCVHSMRNRSSHHCIKEYSNRIFRCQETNPTFCLNVSDFPAGIRKNPNKVGFVQGLSRICPFSNQQKACIIKTTQGAQDKAPQ